MSVPLARRTTGHVRTAPVTPDQTSTAPAASPGTFPKLTVRVRFPSPAPNSHRRAGIGNSSYELGLRIDSYFLNGDDLAAFVRRHDVPDGHAVGWQVQLVCTRQRIVGWKGLSQPGHRFLQQVEDGPLDRPPQLLGKSLNLLLCPFRKANLTIRHECPRPPRAAHA